VIVYKTAPDIMMPNAFSPNGDGKNDIIRPVLIGISSLDYFKVFNRWGQQVFSTTELNRGWDGRISGIMQDPSTYVFMVQGRDYTGKLIAKKGSFVLLR
jgi:gliding motility-associated-like protein